MNSYKICFATLTIGSLVFTIFIAEILANPSTFVKSIFYINTTYSLVIFQSFINLQYFISKLIYLYKNSTPVPIKDIRNIAITNIIIDIVILTIVIIANNNHNFSIVGHSIQLAIISVVLLRTANNTIINYNNSLDSLNTHILLNNINNV